MAALLNVFSRGRPLSFPQIKGCQQCYKNLQHLASLGIVLYIFQQILTAAVLSKNVSYCGLKFFRKSILTQKDRSSALNGSLGSEDQDQSENDAKWECDCNVLDGFLDTCKKSVVKGGDWVHFCCKPEKSLKCNLNEIPVLHHLYLDDQKVEINHCHI